MKIESVNDLNLAPYIAQSQVAMALETEDYKLDYDTVLKGVTTVMQDKSKGEYFITFIDQEPVACLLVVYEWSDWRCQSVQWINSVYVEPKHRKKGIYKKMYEHLKGLVQEDDAFAGLRLYVDKRNKNALEVYHKLGMESHHYTLCEWLKED